MADVSPLPAHLLPKLVAAGLTGTLDVPHKLLHDKWVTLAECVLCGSLTGNMWACTGCWPYVPETLPVKPVRYRVP